jgi:uncharacterized protein (TIGR03083 family)
MDRLAAMRSEREACLAFCRQLTPEQWQAPSAAEGWRIQDVVAHLGGIAHEFFTPYMAKVIRARSIERFNDQTVERRSGRTAAEILAEYETWTGRLGKLLAAANRTPLGKAPFKLAEMGWYPMGVLASAVVFDTHTHLRHDMAAALELEAPPTDAIRMAAILEWMFAVLERSRRPEMGWLDRPVALTLTGPGGGTWRIEPQESGRLTARPGSSAGAVAHITGSAEDVPRWSTGREPWEKCSFDITGDQNYAARFLGSMRII